jgi:5-methyltetrahydrofolate--homocysteine methyltransferase
MRASLAELLATGKPLLADGATGTNYFAAGLASGEPPEFWTVDRSEEVTGLHQRFVDAGADIILTNTFGCNPHRLKLHKAEARTFELAKGAAELARQVADAAPRAVVVGGSVGPTGELFEPLGAASHRRDVEVAAVGAGARHALGEAAVVAAQRAVELVKHAPGAAMGAGAFPAAVAAMQHRGIAAAIEKHQALLTARNPLLDGVDQRR